MEVEQWIEYANTAVKFSDFESEKKALKVTICFFAAIMKKKFVF